MIARGRVIEKPLDGTWSLQVAEQGYAIVPRVLDQEGVEQLLLALENSPSRRSRAGIRHLLHHSVVNTLANDPRLLGIAQSVLGYDALPFRATLFDKSPDSNWLITWHQDTALPLREKHEAPGWGPWSVKERVTYAHAPAPALEQVVALRFHLDDSTDENGPLRVIAGTHHKGILTDLEVEAIVSNSKAVTCVAPKGGVIVMRPLIIHASSKSQSEVPRRVLHIEYATPKTVCPPLKLAIA